jgi:hypothetical protein
MYNNLMHLNQYKAADPDDVSNWIVKEYAEFLPQPLTDIINMAFNLKKNGNYVSLIWKNVKFHKYFDKFSQAVLIFVASHNGLTKWRHNQMTSPLTKWRHNQGRQFKNKKILLVENLYLTCVF